MLEGTGLRKPTNALFNKIADAKAQPFTGIEVPLSMWRDVCMAEGQQKGLAPGWQVVLAGATGQKKSQFALNVIAHAMLHGHKSAYFSGELTLQTVLDRLMALLTGMPIQNLYKYGAGEEEIRAVYDTYGPIVGEHLQLNSPDHRFTLSNILSDMETASACGVRLFVVDYVQQLVEGSGQSFARMAEVCKGIQEATRSLGVVTILVSQFNRSIQREGGPAVHGLADGSYLERHAEQVLMLDFANVQYDSFGEQTKTWLIVGKNRHGPVTDIPISWSHRTLSVSEPTPVDEIEKWPGYKKHKSFMFSQPTNTKLPTITELMEGRNAEGS